MPSVWGLKVLKTADEFLDSKASVEMDKKPVFLKDWQTLVEVEKEVVLSKV